MNVTSYPQFPQLTDCDERLRRLEASKDARIEQQANEIDRLRRALDRTQAVADVRKEVHRDDYLRSGRLMAALLWIMELPLNERDRAGEIATEAIHAVWGVVIPPYHCDNHTRYHPTCSECRALSPSAARGDEDGRAVPSPEL